VKKTQKTSLAGITPLTEQRILIYFINNTNNNKMILTKIPKSDQY